MLAVEVMTLIEVVSGVWAGVVATTAGGMVVVGRAALGMML
jgi:hypothetical protein